MRPRIRPLPESHPWVREALRIARIDDIAQIEREAAEARLVMARVA